MPRADAYDDPCCIEGVSIAPQGNFCQERQKLPKTPFETKVSKSYVLRTRMHSTSQKSIACGSYFWDRSGKVTKEAPQGTDGSLTSFILQELQTKTGLNVALSLLLFSLPHRSKM